MDVIGGMQRAHAALAESRAGEAQRIAETVEKQGIVGVLGEAEVGKTETIRQALARLNRRVALVYIDFDLIASDAHLGFQVAKQLARALTAGVDLSLLAAGALVPARLDRTRLVLSEILGIDGVEEALREWPSGTYGSVPAFEALRRATQERDVLLWIDHLEAPRLTPRHPVNVGRLLWGIRELHQQESFRVLVSAREGIAHLITGPKAAFHQQGQWLTLDVPSVTLWRDVARKLNVATKPAQELAMLTNGHPQTMLLALTMLALAEPGWPRYGVEHVLAEMAAQDDGVATRAAQHARSLHRLGEQVLVQVARGQKPYAAAQRGTASTQEISKVLARLRLAGLLRRADQWQVVNPLVAIRARGTMKLGETIEDWEGIDS